MKYKQQVTSEVTKKVICIDTILDIKWNFNHYESLNPEKISPLVETNIKHKLSETSVENADGKTIHKTSFSFNECTYSITFTREEKEYLISKKFIGE